MITHATHRRRHRRGDARGALPRADGRRRAHPRADHLRRARVVPGRSRAVFPGRPAERHRCGGQSAPVYVSCSAWRGGAQIRKRRRSVAPRWSRVRNAGYRAGGVRRPRLLRLALKRPREPRGGIAVPFVLPFALPFVLPFVLPFACSGRGRPAIAVAAPAPGESRAPTSPLRPEWIPGATRSLEIGGASS
jgi:hypothetical protein